MIAQEWVNHRPETTNPGFLPDANRWRLRDYFAEAVQVAGTIFAGGVLPTLIVVLCFAWGA